MKREIFPGILGRSESRPIRAALSDIVYPDKRGGFGAKDDDKAPPWVMLKPWSDSRPPTPSMTKLPPPIRAATAPVALRAAAIAPARRAEFRADQPTVATNISVLGAAAETARRRRRRGPSGFFAGARLALLDQILRADPPFAGALRQRLALRAATACAALARHREDFPRCATPSIFRPTPAGTRPPAPPAASIGCGACFALRSIAARCADAANRRRSSRPFGRRQLRGVRRRLAGPRDRRRNIRSRRPRARAPRR